MNSGLQCEGIPFLSLRRLRFAVIPSIIMGGGGGGAGGGGGKGVGEGTG